MPAVPYPIRAFEWLREDLLRFALRYTEGDRHRAEDVLSDAFIRVHRSHTTYRSSAPIKSWLFSVIYHAFIDLKRDDKKYYGHNFPLDDAAELYQNTTHHDLETRILADKIHVAIDNVSARERDVFTLVEIEGLSYIETAEAIGTEVGTVKSRLNRSKATIRARVGYQTQ